MPKFLLLKHYGGDPDVRCTPMSEWTPSEVAAHIDFQRDIGRMLTESGEFVDAQGLSSDGAWVRYGGLGEPPVVTDGPFPETKELIAGWFLVDVESAERAYEIAAYASSAPGNGGEPIYERIEVRQVMGAPATVE